MSIVTKERLLTEFDELRTRTHEVSVPEICAELARLFFLPVEAVLDVVNNRESMDA
jgi:hypothetical protein